jgi:hypothetical protein
VGSSSGIISAIPINACGYGPESTLSVSANTNITEIIEQPENVIASIGDAISFEVQANGDNLSYVWQFEGQDIISENNPSYSIEWVQNTDFGKYNVIVSGKCGTETSNIAELIMTTNAQILIKEGFKIYPNPSDGIFIIKTEKESNEFNITIKNINGKQVLQKSFTQNEIEINLTNEPSGIYLINFESEGKTFSLKIIKK